MEIQKSQKVKASQKILSFVRNEREKGKETFIIHRSDRGMKEIPAKPPSEFDKKMDRTRLSDGILDEDEIEDLDKVYDQVKKFIEHKHGTTFKPSNEEVKKFMDAYLTEKNKKINKNAFNSYLNCKKIREEYMRSKIEKRQEKKRMRELAMQGIIVKEIQPEVELKERDKKLLQYFQQPYEQRPNSVNVNLRISQYNKRKVDINKECQILQKECNDMIKDQLNNPNKSLIQGMSNTNQSFLLQTPIVNRAQTAQSGMNGRSATRSSNRNKPIDDASFTKSCNHYLEDDTAEQEKQVQQKDISKTTKKIRFERSLDLSSYNMAEKSNIDMRNQQNTSYQFYNNNKDIDYIESSPITGQTAKRDNLMSTQAKSRNGYFSAATRDTQNIFYTPNSNKQKGNQDESYYEPATFITTQTINRSNIKKVQHRDLNLSLADNLNDNINNNNTSLMGDKFVRKTIISMVTGKPIRPYLQLASLSEKIEMRGKERKQRERTRILDDNKLKSMDEFRNYNFTSDQKNIPNTHSNFINSHINANIINININQNNQNGMQGIQSVNQSNTNSFSGSQKIQRKSVLNNMSNAVSKITSQRQSILAMQEKKKSQFNNYSNDNSISSPYNQQQDALRNKQQSISWKSQGISSQGHTPNNVTKDSKKRSVSNLESQKVSITNEIKELVKLENTEQSFSLSGRGETKYESQIKTIKPFTKDVNAFSVNRRLGNYQKLVERINIMRSHMNFKPSFWEEMKNLDEQIQLWTKESKDNKINLRKKQQSLGRKQFQALKNKEDEEEEIKAQKFEKLVQRTQYYENKLIQQFEDIKKTKQRKNEEFKFLIETFNRDRPMTREIRLRNYNLTSPLNPQSAYQGNGEKENEHRKNLSLHQMRENAEEERKKVLEANEKQVEWYQQSVNKLALLSSNEEDMSICHLLMDQVKQILEDGTPFELNHIEYALSLVENNKKLQYNSNSLYCVEIALSLFSIHITDLSSLYKLQEAYQKKQNQREKSHKTEASSTVHSSTLKQEQ